MSGSVAGAEMTTFFAPAWRCFSASGRFVKKPGRLDRDVDAEIAPWRSAGSRSETNLISWPSTVIGRRRLDRRSRVPEHGVVLEQVRHRLRVAEVVRGHDLEVAA